MQNAYQKCRMPRKSLTVHENRPVLESRETNSVENARDTVRILHGFPLPGDCQGYTNRVEAPTSGRFETARGCKQERASKFSPIVATKSSRVTGACMPKEERGNEKKKREERSTEKIRHEETIRYTPFQRQGAMVIGGCTAGYVSFIPRGSARLGSARPPTKRYRPLGT